MWALLTQAWQVQIFVALTIVVVLALEGINEWWTGQSLSPDKAVSMASFVIAVVLSRVANWTWRAVWRWVPFLNKFFFPDLNGHAPNDPEELSYRSAPGTDRHHDYDLAGAIRHQY